MGPVLAAGHGPPPAHDLSVVAHPGPTSPSVRAMGVKGQVHDALGSHSGVGGSIPAHEGFVVPEPGLTSPAVAPILDGDRSFGVEVEDVASLVSVNSVGVDSGDAVFPGFLAGPPDTGEVELVADLASDLG